MRKNCTYPKHCPEVRVSETKRYVADVQAFWLTFEVGALCRCRGCRRAWRDRYQRSSLHSTFGIGLIATAWCWCWLLATATRGCSCRCYYCSLEYLRLLSEKKNKIWNCSFDNAKKGNHKIRLVGKNDSKKYHFDLNRISYRLEFISACIVRKGLDLQK